MRGLYRGSRDVKGMCRMLEIGTLIDGKYRILKKIGEGGMSTVYLALNERAGKTWAVKEVRTDIHDEGGGIAQKGLIAETEMLKKLRHPRLPEIVDIIDGDGFFLVVMDYVEGKPLDKILDEEGAVDEKRVIVWGMELCDVLGYLHSREPPVIYRDMKPANIMLLPDGGVALLDFGTAREYKDDGIEDTVYLGTRGFAAPEQYGGGGQTDARTDIYCLGATLYCMLTGHNPALPPYGIRPIREWNAGLSVSLEKVVVKCTRTDPDDRYQSCQELMYALEHIHTDDAAYSKKRLCRFAGFALPLTAAFIIGTAVLISRAAQENMLKKEYDAYLAAAESADTKEEEIEDYCLAVILDPYEGEAYMELLEDGFLDDGVFTEEESLILKELLIEYGGGGQTNEAVFQSNGQEYDEFAYKAGLAYYYYYEDSGSKKNAKAYLKTASQSEYLDEVKVLRAMRLYTISDYYSKIGLVDEAGDVYVSYREYWEDLTALAGGNLVETDNERTALVVYGEIAAQIISRADEFRKDGVTQGEMEAVLADIERHLETDFTDGDGSYTEEVDELGEAVAQARLIEESVFGMDARADIGSGT